MSSPTGGADQPPKNPLQEIVQPFIDLVHAPRALWGINLAYVIEGMVYFGMLGYLAIHFSSYIFQGVEHADEWSHNMVMVLTSGITLAMFLLGFVADKWGVRFALIAAFVLLLLGRVLISAAPTIFGLTPHGVGSPLHWVTMAGILLVIIGYGMYQPAAYAGVRQFTTPKTAAMGFAMLYALMNLGGWLPSFAFLLRDDNWAGMGITGVYWVYTAFTLVALLCTVLILTRSTVADAVATAKRETAAIKAAEQAALASTAEAKPTAPPETLPGGGLPPLHLWVFVALIVAAACWRLPDKYRWPGAGLIAAVWLLLVIIPDTRRYIARHPLTNAKFFFFIFALIPVQTLFTYNWLVLPQYISRAFAGGWIGEYFEIASNANPILIFILVPIITAVTQKAKVYNMMILGTCVMAAPAFLLALGPHWWTLFPYILIMTIGEAMWQPRFLQYAAEIAPEGRTGAYMGVAQLPWFLTKMLVPLLYSGWMMNRYCPEIGEKKTEFMWLIFGCIAITSTILLILAKGWIGKDFKTKAD
ncbi:MAG: MFS transporter [Planctomycetota bacterium]